MGSGPLIRILAALALLASPAWATVDGWPALYDVSGVASDDVLNIRSEPGAAGDVIGALPPDATFIEVIRPSDDFDWGLINTGEGTGWVSLAYMVRHEGQWDGQIPDLRQCFGTEPFWSMSIDPPRMTLETPEPLTRNGLISGLYSSTSRRDLFAFRGSTLPDGDGPLEFTMIIRNQACSDGMSDRAYGYAMDFLMIDQDATDGMTPAIMITGCCSLQPRERSE